MNITNHTILTTSQIARQKHLSVLSALSYFEIFQYPLTAAEVLQFACSPSLTPEEVFFFLEESKTAGLVFQFGAYFQTIDDPMWVPRRAELNERADKFLPTAYRMGRFIGAFPFVKGVMVSGSLSKHCMSEDGDIDFFIITAPGRLWLARTMLVIFKKIFLFNSRKYFCVNYFIDTEHLEIEEKNSFTATECATLLPVYNGDWYHQFLAANTWVNKGYYPHFSPRGTQHLKTDSKNRLKRALEWILDNRLGTLLDRWSMRMTVAFWRRKFHHFDTQKFDLALKSRTYISKHHPLAFQEKVTNKHAALMAERSAKVDGNVF